MKINKNSILSLLLCIFSFHWGWTQKEEEVKKFALDIAKQCCSNAYEIIEQDKAQAVAFWMGYETDKINLSSFGTTVHECLHAYDLNIGWYGNHDTKIYGSYPQAYFIDKDIKIVVKELEVFKTSLLHPNYYPKEVQNLFRYSTYIYNHKSNSSSSGNKAYDALLAKKESENSSNLSGIYGLLEEFNAYYHGTNAEFELMKSDLDVKYFSSTSLLTASYYEFNIFMAYYLKYAKEKKPEIYQMLLQQKDLRIAYTLAEKNWRTLLTNIYTSEKYAAWFPSAEGEEQLFTSELRTIMNNFMLSDNELSAYATFLKKQKYQPDAIKKNRPPAGSINPHHHEDFDEMFNNMNDFINKMNDLPNDSDRREIEISSESGDDVFKSFDTKKYYVIIYKGNQLLDAMQKLLEYHLTYEESDLYTDNALFYVVIKTFDQLSEATQFKDSVKSKIPNVEIYKK